MNQMRPAFSSTKQAAAFMLLLLIVLLSPLLAGKRLLPPREQAYSSRGWNMGPVAWIRHEIYEETNDIDIAFVGSSHILHALDTPYVQATLSEQLHRPAVVRTIGWAGGGYDAFFLIAQDLLTHRRVRLLAFYDEQNVVHTRNSMMTFLFRYGENADSLRGLAFADAAHFYFSAIVGMPHNLIEMFRPNLAAPLVTALPNYWERSYGSPSIVELLGATRSELGFTRRLDQDDFTPFVPYQPATGVMAADAEVYSPARKNDFRFTGEAMPDWHLHFAKLFAALARDHGCKLVMLHIPVLGEARLPEIRERRCWPEILPGLTLLGVPPAKMFGGLTDDEIRQLYFNPAHFNKNGVDYFTPLITPALIHLYESSPDH
jgi:hypothetical protein